MPSIDDPSGFERLRHTRGPGRYVAIFGLLTMLGGLGVFGFALVSVFGSTDRIPGIPPLVPVGFGIAIVGAIAYSLGLAFGVPTDADLGGGIRIDHVGARITSGRDMTITAPIDARVNLTIDQRRIEIVNRIYRSMDDLTLPDDDWPDAEAAIEGVRSSVEDGRPQSEIAEHLEHFTRILASGGALASAGSATANAIIELARTLGPYGRAVLGMFGL